MDLSKKTNRNHHGLGWTLACLIALLWTLPTPGPAQDQENPPVKEDATTTSTSSSSASSSSATSPKIEWLFVQNAEGVTFKDGKMTLKKVNPITVMFADRPERIAGHITNKEFMPLWDEGKDSFTHDPPNATLSVFNEKGEPQDVVVEIKNPQLNGDELTYDVRILEGKEIAQSGPCSLFIDIIGMPLTPRSFQGVERRAWRRGF